MTVVHLKWVLKQPIDENAILDRINNLERFIDANHKKTKKALKQLRASIRGGIDEGEDDPLDLEEISIRRKHRRFAAQHVDKVVNRTSSDSLSTSSSESDDDEQISGKETAPSDSTSNSNSNSGSSSDSGSSSSSESSSSSDEDERGKTSDGMIIDPVDNTGSSSNGKSSKEAGGLVAPVTTERRGRSRINNPTPKNKLTGDTIPQKRGRPLKRKPVNSSTSEEEDSSVKKPMVIPASPAPSESERQVPSKPDTRPTYTLSREISSVQEVWKEWRHGLGRQLPAVERLESEYGASWREHDTEFYLNERRPIITEVIKRVNEHGEDEELASERLEIYRIKNSIPTLSDLAKRIRVHRQMDEERGLVPPTLFNKYK